MTALRGRQTATSRVVFLAANADGIGGIARSVHTLASSLADRHEVEIISVYRRRQEPAYAVDPRVSVTYLQDARPEEGFRGERPEKGYRLATAGPVHAWLNKRRSFATGDDDDFTGLTDLLLVRKLRSLPPCVLISTRPSLHTAVSRFTPRHVITIAQDHMNFVTRGVDPALFERLLRSVRRLDAFVVLTQADARDYTPLMRGRATVLTSIPNASPWPVGDPAPLASKVVVAAGHLIERKGFDRMVEAWARVAVVRPDWRLHIYGVGELRRTLNQQIRDLGLTHSVRLKGHTMAFEQVLADASVYAMTSHEEGFPMVLVEAMSKGVPPVSMDCPRGPAEIISDGRNGRLTPDGDIDAFSGALLQLTGDDQLRAAMGRAALADAHKYSVEAISAQWSELFEQLSSARRA